jgi:hypothetical protein
MVPGVRGGALVCYVRCALARYATSVVGQIEGVVLVYMG